MTIDELLLSVDTTSETCKALIKHKQAEYAEENDVFLAFKKSANLQNISVEQALGGMMAKHVSSVYDLISDTESKPSLRMWDEKIIDNINYLLILRAYLYEANRMENDRKVKGGL